MADELTADEQNDFDACLPGELGKGHGYYRTLKNLGQTTAQARAMLAEMRANESDAATAERVAAQAKEDRLAQYARPRP